jgi:hypothetical protein
MAPPRPPPRKRPSHTHTTFQGPFFFIIYVALAIFVILNMLIAIISDAYSVCRERMHHKKKVNLGADIIHYLESVVVGLPIVGPLIRKAGVKAQVAGLQASHSIRRIRGVRHRLSWVTQHGQVLPQDGGVQQHQKPRAGSPLSGGGGATLPEARAEVVETAVGGNGRDDVPGTGFSQEPPLSDVDVPAEGAGVQQREQIHAVLQQCSEHQRCTELRFAEVQSQMASLATMLQAVHAAVAPSTVSAAVPVLPPLSQTPSAAGLTPALSRLGEPVSAQQPLKPPLIGSMGPSMSLTTSPGA